MSRKKDRLVDKDRQRHGNRDMYTRGRVREVGIGRETPTEAEGVEP